MNKNVGRPVISAYAELRKKLYFDRCKKAEVYSFYCVIAEKVSKGV